MKFGISTFVTDEGIRPDALAEAVEERGFDSLFLAEHSHIPASRQTPYPGGGELPRSYYRTFDPFVALSAAAVATERLLLATGVALLPQRDLFHTANEVASLDLLSGGRFLFGVGVGWNREEMRNHGTDPATRGALLNEQLRALKQLWTSEEAQFHGEYIDFDPVYLWPRPARQPHPPIYVGGESPAALARLAEHGDCWLPRAHTTPERIRAARRLLAERGRPDIPVTIFAAGRDSELIEGWAQAGVERVTFFLPTRSRDETLRLLDERAVLAEAHQG